MAHPTSVRLTDFSVVPPEDGRVNRSRHDQHSDQMPGLNDLGPGRESALAEPPRSCVVVGKRIRWLVGAA